MALSSTPLTVKSCCVGALLSAAKHGDDSRCVSISSHILAFPSVFRALMWKGGGGKSLIATDLIMCVPVPHLFLISEHERHSHQKNREGDKKKQPFSACHEERDLCRSFSLLHLTTVSHLCSTPLPLPSAPPPTPPSSSRLLCNTRLLRLLCFFVCVDFSGGSPLFAVAAEGTARKLFMFTLTAAAVTHWDLSAPSLAPLLYFWTLQLCSSCVHAAATLRALGNDAVDRKRHHKWHNNDGLPLVWRDLWIALWAFSLRGYRPAFDSVVVTWYFTGPSLVFTETTRRRASLYGLFFFLFAAAFASCLWVFTFKFLFSLPLSGGKRCLWEGSGSKSCSHWRQCAVCSYNRWNWKWNVTCNWKTTTCYVLPSGGGAGGGLWAPGCQLDWILFFCLPF